jgi:hypothetical protein
MAHTTQKKGTPERWGTTLALIAYRR